MAMAETGVWNGIARKGTDHMTSMGTAGLGSRTTCRIAEAWDEDASWELLDYRVDTTSCKVLFGSRCTLKNNERMSGNGGS